MANRARRPLPAVPQGPATLTLMAVAMTMLLLLMPAPRAPLFAQWCLAAGIAQGDFDHFVAHGVRRLSAYGSGKNTPAGATRVISIAAYQAAFEDYDYSLASAIAMIMGAVQLAIVAAVLWGRSLLYTGPVGGTKG